MLEDFLIYHFGFSAIWFCLKEEHSRQQISKRPHVLLLLANYKTRKSALSPQLEKITEKKLSEETKSIHKRATWPTNVKYERPKEKSERECLI